MFYLGITETYSISSAHSQSIWRGYKIRIKSLGIPGVVEVEFEYEKPKARKEAFQFADPGQYSELVETEEATI